MGRRNAAVVDEADIVDDYSPSRGRGQARWSDRAKDGSDQRRPANPWTPPNGYTPAKPIEPPKRDWPPMEILYEERPPYSL